ncbi:hypothetical protein HNQ50_001560 [Silvimonas terrae]|uniref:Uncharacterized protein n=1 Tax=Silvimonas terrae TaxID=300266 RepID=A0A840RCZ0_9NEIS|nr:hypothetical protein [Silvimonas terrae]MBB5190837.1 hypothetical protein [Silvimonas terrae]
MNAFWRRFLPAFVLKGAGGATAVGHQSGQNGLVFLACRVSHRFAGLSETVFNNVDQFLLTLTRPFTISGKPPVRKNSPAVRFFGTFSQNNGLESPKNSRIAHICTNVVHFDAGHAVGGGDVFSRHCFIQI